MRSNLSLKRYILSCVNVIQSTKLKLQKEVGFDHVHGTIINLPKVCRDIQLDHSDQIDEPFISQGTTCNPETEPEFCWGV